MKSRRVVFEKALKMALDEMEAHWEIGPDHGRVAEFKFELRVTMADKAVISCCPQGTFPEVADRLCPPPVTVTPDNRFEREEVL